MASLLLRLFHSDYFSPHLALSYLKTYSDNIGITYYLVYRLKTSFPPEQVEFYWPQLCHLLITKPSDSRALECFILERCEESVHVALLTLWNLQAALYDLSSNPHTASFQVCKRVYNECQRILFDDPLSDSRIGRLVSSQGRTKEKVSPWNTRAAFVGIGTVLASTPGMPTLAPFSGQVAIEQGRAKPRGKTVDKLADGIARLPGAAGEDSGEESGDDRDTRDDEDDDEDDGKTPTALKRTHSNQKTVQTPHRPTPPSILSNNAAPFANISAGFQEFRGKATAAVGEAFGQTFGVTFPAADSKHGQSSRPRPAWHPHRSGKRRGSRPSRDGEDDGDDDDEQNGAQSSHDSRSHPSFRSQPNLNNASRGSLSAYASTVTLPDGTSAPLEAVLAQYDTEARRRLLRSNYCRTQTQFLLELQDISARLLQLPKPARLSALRAELTALNHKLPSDVCFPLWCSASNAADTKNAIENQHSVPGADGRQAATTKGKKRQQAPTTEHKHHRVVRINPSEAVVLNSADRAPYLLHVEILNDDLDFDPERRSNRENLKRLVVQEDVRRRKFQLTRSFATDSEASSRGELGKRDPARVISTPGEETHESHEPIASSSTAVVPAERSLSGSGIPKSRAVSGTAVPLALLDSPRPASPMALPGDDEEIDLTEQAYGSDLAAFGEEREDDSDEEEHLTVVNRNHDTAAWTEARQGAGGPSSGQPRHSRQGSIANGASRRRDFSLDEYSERMRTAAIMLAQLNQSTNAGAQPVVTHNPHVSATAQGGWSSWIIGTSWAASSNASGAKNEIGQGSAGVKAPVSAPPMVPHERSSDSTNSTLAAGTARQQPNATPHPLPPPVAGGPSRLIHADTESIRKRIMQEMMLLEEERMERMKSGTRRMGQRRPTAGVEDEATVLKAVNKDDPSAAMFKETWAAKKARIRAGSPYGHLPSWDVFSVIVKTGADLRQEQLAVQLINEFGRIWAECGSKLWVRYFRILVTSENSGLMETVTDAVSVHSIKKEAYARAQKELAGQDGGKIATYSIFDHFVNTYGEPSSAKFNRARDRFMESLAAYSIISYLLQIKDRHNGNILLSSDGRIIHIDFGFMLGISPGGVGFEAAPFKLTQEYIDILGGVGSPKFEEFKSLMRQGFKDVRKHAERIIMVVELMQKDSKLPCFALGEFTASNLRDRFALALSANQIDEFVDRLVLASCASSYTRLYDSFQYYSQGIL